MNQDTLGGSAKINVGRAESELGALFGDPKLQARGEATGIEGSVQEVYGRAIQHANKVASDVDQVLSERTYAALGAAVVAGLVLGLLLAAGRTKVVYVRK